MPVQVDINARAALLRAHKVRMDLMLEAQTPMGRALLDAGNRVAGQAQRYAPVDRGQLRASIQPGMPEAKPEGFTEIAIGTDLEYAPYQEFGTRPFWPPAGALQPWARRHGVDEFVIRRAIARHGIRPKKFLTRAYQENQEYIRRRIARGIAEALA
jgi:HK97 gp10 family phage protein